MAIHPDDIRICLEDHPAREPGIEPMATPIVQTSLFAFPDFDTFIEAGSAENKHTVYTRGQNPTVEVLERKLAQLERGEACKAFGSGMAAISAVIMGLLDSGDVYEDEKVLIMHGRRALQTWTAVVNKLTGAYSGSVSQLGMSYTQFGTCVGKDIE